MIYYHSIMQKFITANDFFKKTFVLDLETTGIDPIENGVLSVGAVSLIDPDNQFYAECKIDKNTKVDNKALEYNGFSKKEVFDKDKKTELEVGADLLKWIQDNKFETLAGHNISFDKEFLIFRLKLDRGLGIFKGLFDLYSLAAFMFCENLRSFQICDKLNVAPEPFPHNALEGALMERNCFVKLLQYDYTENFSSLILENAKNNSTNKT